jgi:putative Mg2+ transporter-C (MgtC) family protein
MTEYDILLRAVAALLAGGVVGLERTYRGRAAGLRTFSLVALAAAILVAMAEYAADWTKPGTGDPTRVIQGIVTGIGFLGAGVIIKEGYSVRGLTTAASVWVAAAIGSVFGAGLFVTGSAVTVLAWSALEVLRLVENRIPVHLLVHCMVAFKRGDPPSDAELRALVGRCGLAVGEIAYRLDGTADCVEYELALSSTDAGAMHSLERTLLADPRVRDFRIAPTRD